MHRPLHVTSETFAGLSLAPLVDELLASGEVQREGKTGRTLAKSDSMTVVLTVMRAGERVLHQRIPTPALVVPIRGDISFDRVGDSLHASTEGDSVVLMGPGLEHEFLAHTDGAFLLVMGPRDDERLHSPS
jgi:quercetin dioxygenase-like cupin family protein